MKEKKTERQPEIAMMVWPEMGASAGTKMNSPITKDMMRAISAPGIQIANKRYHLTMRGPATPKPCKKRPSRSISKLVENQLSRLPIMKMKSPMNMPLLRPI